MPKDEQNTYFEEAIAEIETLVNCLEAGDRPLESALKDFELGITLIRKAQKSLEEAEQKVQILLDDGTPTARNPSEDCESTSIKE